MMQASMHVLYAGMGEVWSAAVRGAAYEDRFFRDPLGRLPGVTLEHFDYADVAHRLGRGPMSRELRDRALETRPDVLFVVPCDPAIDPLRETLAEITAAGVTRTVVWICDDPWQFADYSRHWAQCVDWLVTTDPDCLDRYAACGARAQILLSQWAFDESLCTPRAVPVDIDVSFVGQPHGDRRGVVRRLQASGLEVATFGHGWERDTPPLDPAEMVDVFCRSKINLNFEKSFDQSAVQIKARNFEVVGSGGFLLTAAVPHLERYFDIGREIATFTSEADLIHKAHYFLEHDEERRAIAARGRERCLREHTWAHRLTELLAQIGLIDQAPAG